MDEDEHAIIVDNGSDTIKAGVSGDAGPRAVFPTAWGYSKEKYTNKPPTSSFDKDVLV